MSSNNASTNTNGGSVTSTTPTSKPADTKPVDTKPVDTKPVDTKSTDTTPVDTKSTDTKSTDTKSTDTKSTDTKSTDTKSTDTTSSENTSSIDDITKTFNTIFSNSNIVLVLWFLAAYFISYAVLGTFSSSLTGPEYMLKIVDVLILIAIFAYLISYYYYKPESETNIKKTTYNTLNDTNTLIYTGLFLVLYNLIAFVFHIPTSGSIAPVSLWILSTLATVVFTITAIVLFCKYVLGISILDADSIKAFWKGDSSDSTSEDETDNQTPSSGGSKEVFNISNNLYTYEDARAVCSAYGARLATYDEIEDAYNNGGEWCNYGWSEGQMAYFPTQKATWEELQKTPKKKNNCGRPGINGGYMENPYIKFGVNCFGKKPNPTDKDIKAMAANKLQPKTEEDSLIDKKVQFWKDNADKLLNMNAFNRNSWSEY
uniref:Link domain-containing protein n=1 Tax=viral metagenome TaxID=1070528 RepID=A0A6C0JZK0_9ZZZZ